jgi:sigma-B regulation protein RsbU (phosphoserine phosphatase)
MRNVYDTTDPEVLLRLKRQEADSLRELIRSLNDPKLRIEHIFKIAQNTLLAQLGVRRMRFIYHTREGQYRTGLQFGMSQFPMAACAELPRDTAIAKVTPERFPLLAAEKVEYVLPVNYFDKVAAWFLIAEFADSEAEAENDLIFIETVANVLSAALENRHLLDEMVLQENVRREMEVAERIQKQLLVQDFSDVVGAEVFAENVAHYRIGGDFYDVIPRGDKGFFLCIADVSGKGISAALLMANLQANLRALILSQNTLEDIIVRLHQNLHQITHGEKFVTLFLAHVRIQDREIDYINAGHHPAALHTHGDIALLDKGTIPLGIISLPAVHQGTVRYEKGDLLFMYTDGLVEQHNSRDEILGEQPVLRKLREIQSASAPEVVKEIRELHQRHAGGAEHEDDITLMAVKLM